MIKLDNDWLGTVGLSELPAEAKNRFLAFFYEKLESAVGMSIAEQMTNQQLDEFDGFIKRKDEKGALTFLETNMPHYKQIVAENLATLEAEVRANAAAIVAAETMQ